MNKKYMYTVGITSIIGEDISTADGWDCWANGSRWPKYHILLLLFVSFVTYPPCNIFWLKIGFLSAVFLLSFLFPFIIISWIQRSLILNACSWYPKWTRLNYRIDAWSSNYPAGYDDIEKLDYSIQM